MVKEHIPHHHLEQLATQMGWRCFEEVIALDDPAVRLAWGMAPEDQMRVRLLAHREQAHLVLIDRCERRSDVLSAIARVHNARPGACLCWWWPNAEGVTMIIHTPDVLIFEHLIDQDTSTWARLGWDEAIDDGALDPFAAWCAHLAQVGQQHALTQRFYRSFVHAHATLTTTMIDGPEDDASREALALTMLLRILILYFLQSRGALDRDDRFLWRHLCKTIEHGGGFHHRVLHKLCFGALNCPSHKRTQDVKALGQFPFLNGGLFEPSSLEQRHPCAHWSDDTWRDVLSMAFECYRFVLFEGGGEGVDPEMLGQVFEGLMASHTRQKTGAYYTPRSLVRQMVRRALSTHLEQYTECSSDQVQRLFQSDISWCDQSQRDQLIRALTHLTILDPAVGTGAFLLEALQQLRHLHMVLQGSFAGFEKTRQLIHAHLYGVDLNGVSVRLCEVRLWLALLSTLPEHIDLIDSMEPLPNFGHRIVQGDSLIGWAARTGLRVDQQVWCRPDVSMRQQIDAIKCLNQAYMTAHGSIKGVLRRCLHRREAQLMLAMIEARGQQLRLRLSALNTEQGVLFEGNEDTSAVISKAQLVLTTQLENLARLASEVQSSLHQLGFDYALYFPDVFAHGGFDLVVTNPPWVRANDQLSEDRRLFRSIYQAADGQLWPQAKACGIRAPYGTQVDLSALFIERSMEVLKPGGVCAALVPSKLMRSLHGASLRALLKAHHMIYIEDMADASEAHFDATTYPAFWCIQKHQPDQSLIRRRPQRDDVEVVVWSGDDTTQTHITRTTLGAAPWLLSRQDQWTTRHKALGTWTALRPRRGIMTGCNDVFVHHAPPQWMMPFVKSVLMGRDIGAFEVEPKHHILWPYDAHGKPLESLESPQLQAYFERHSDKLLARRDHKARSPLWQMFRVHPSMLGHKVVWRDMGEQLQACAVDAQMLVLNTVYYIGTVDAVRAWMLSVYLNHPMIRSVAHQLAERARGGWRRYFAWVISLLPMPSVLAEWLTTQSAPAQWRAWHQEDKQAHAQDAITALLLGQDTPQLYAEEGRP